MTVEHGKTKVTWKRMDWLCLDRGIL